MIDTLLGDALAEDWRVYSPVLRAKASEWKALAALRPEVHRRVAPIIEFIPHWKDPGAKTSTRRRRTPQTGAAYVQNFLESCIQGIAAAKRGFVYFGLADPDAKWSGMDLWAEFENGVTAQAHIVPLADLAAVGSSSALTRLVRSRGHLGLRLASGDVTPALGGRVTRALGAVGVVCSSTHLILDLKDSPGAVSHARLRTALPNIDEFASVVILAGVFPKDLTHYQPGITPEPRTEWQTWLPQHSATPVGERLLSFGDYTTQCAHYQPSPEVPGSVSLRYTTDNAILVLRGRQSNASSGLGHEQMHGHCRLLVSRPEYDGAAFSAGDQRIFCWTDPVNGTGNAMQWRSAAIVHHITHTVMQLHDPVGSAASARAWARGQTPSPCP